MARELIQKQNDLKFWVSRNSTFHCVNKIHVAFSGSIKHRLESYQLSTINSTFIIKIVRKKKYVIQLAGFSSRYRDYYTAHLSGNQYVASYIRTLGSDSLTSHAATEMASCSGILASTGSLSVMLQFVAMSTPTKRH